MIRVKKLIFDEWNRSHIARHEVSQDEVEQVCTGSHILRKSYQNRIMLIGLTRDGRVLAIVLYPKGKEAYYVVTARSADRKERYEFISEKGGEKT